MTANITITSKLLNLAYRLRDKYFLLGMESKSKQLVLSVKSKNLTYLTVKKLKSLVDTLNDIEKKGVEGCVIEAGCALGGSSIILGCIKNRDRNLKVYDVFEMIPPPSDQDPPEVHDRYKEILKGESEGINGEGYYGYESNLYELVLANFADFGLDRDRDNIELIKGLLQETLDIQESVSLAHIDVDWYVPVKISLEKIFPNLALGGSIILDDYYDWGGCREATDQFLSDVSTQVELNDSFGSLKITKIK